MIPNFSPMNPAKKALNLRKTLWKLAYAKQAVGQVLKTCDIYEKYASNDRHPLHFPLLCSICVTYARPFTDNGGVGMISEKFTKHSRPELQATHDALWAARMHFYAHCDATLEVASEHSGDQPLQQLAILVSRTSTPDGEELSFGYDLSEVRFREIMVSQVRVLCEELIGRLDQDLSSTLEQLFQDSSHELLRLMDEAKSDRIRIPLDL